MKFRTTLAAAAALAVPGLLYAASPATRDYATQDFQSVEAAAGIEVDITIGSRRSVVAESRRGNFDDLDISTSNGVLRIQRPRRSWFSFGRREDYRVRVVTPALRSLKASAGSEVRVHGVLKGDFEVETSAGSEVDVRGLDAGNVKARASACSEIELAGRCTTLEAHASSGADIDAEDLQCESAHVEGSSGSDISVRVSGRVTGKVSSGADVEVYGRGAEVDVEQSAGGNVKLKD